MGAIRAETGFDWRKYAGIGILIGLVAGIVESTIVHRAGLPFIPFAALVYGVLSGIIFTVIAIIFGVRRRALLPICIGLGVTGFSALELAFYANRASPYPARSLHGMLTSLVVLLASIALGVVAGFLVRRRLRRFNPFKPAVAILAVLAALIVGCSVHLYFDTEPGLNCVLVSIDALRPDHLGCYGYHRKTSPNIDGLAQRGVLCKRAFTQCPGSTGGHASMLTGLYTITHGAYVNGIILQDPVETAAEVFSMDGYSTAAFANNWYIGPAVGFGQGFDIFVNEGYGFQLTRCCPQLLSRGLVLSQTLHRMMKTDGYPTDVEIKDTLRWIRWQRNHKFFVFLHIMDCHCPYVPPASVRGYFPAGSTYVDPGTVVRLHDESLTRRLSPEESRFMVDRYDEEILAADKKIGMLVDLLGELDLLEKTMIIVTADHGEVMGESEEKQFGHGTLDHGALQIPLLMHLPEYASGGKIIESTAMSIDILPTMKEVLNLTDPAHRQGISLVSAEVPSLGVGRPAFATGDIVARESYTVIAGDWQYIVEGDERSLRGVNVEPQGAQAIGGEQAAIEDSLHILLADWLRTCIAEAVVPYSLDAKSVMPSADVKKQLKALGYIE
jgi:arylsulfatase A-like enzyme